MQKNGVILLLILLCVAFLVSCGKRETADQKQGELVKIETEGEIPRSFLYSYISRTGEGGRKGHLS